MAEPWSPTSWRSKPIKQQPKYPDEAKLEAAVDEIRRLPPLVTPQEVDALREQLAEVAEGRRFLIQGGDCAERFLDCAAEPIEKKLRILLQMSLVLTWGARVPTVRIARMAGQFAKPRSKDTEVIDGVEYAAFRGDNVNSFDTSQREADPARMVQGYFYSATTLNYARALLAAGLADLNQASHWDLGFVQDQDHRRQYKAMVDNILSSLDFMRVCGVGNEAALKTADVFISHEGLQLNYEEALTRPSPAPPGSFPGPHSRAGSAAGGLSLGGARAEAGAPTTPVAPPAATAHRMRTPSQELNEQASALAAAAHAHALSKVFAGPKVYYNLGTHFLWIGDRTRQIDHAHIEYFRGIQNPVGIKVGPSSDPGELVRLIRVLWPRPRAQRGRIVLITRLGAGQVRAKLPAIIRAVQDAAFGAPVVWTCDPMHGNTRVTGSGIKTRDFDDILSELRDTFEVHRELGSRLGGCHVELTGENVTECTGGPEKLLEHDLPRRYTTYCDPRLNYAQGMELALLMAQYLADEREVHLVAESGVPTAAFIGSDGERFGSPSLATSQYQQAIVAQTNAGSGGVEGATAALLNRLNSAAAATGSSGSGSAPSSVDASAGGVPTVASGGALDSLGSSDGESRDRSSSLEGGGGTGKLRRPRFAAGRGERPTEQS